MISKVQTAVIIDKSTLRSDTPPDHGKGQLIWWLYHHADYAFDFCLIWPFTTTLGYGILRYDGKRTYAHRFMCELANGPPPTPEHQAAHSCGRGHEGCVNPRHLSWKTISENQLDRRIHGTASRGGQERKLNFEIANRIRALAPFKTKYELADEFGVTRGTITNIVRGRTWNLAARKKRQR